MTLLARVNHQGSDGGGVVLDESAHAADDDAGSCGDKGNLVLHVIGNRVNLLKQWGNIASAATTAFFSERPLLKIVHEDCINEVCAANGEHIVNELPNVRVNPDRGGRCCKAGRRR